jgi:hypothetical protein
MINERISMEEITTFLNQMRFKFNQSMIDQTLIFEFYQNFEKCNPPFHSGLYVKIKGLGKKRVVSINCMEYSYQEEMEKIGNILDFVNHLDEIVLCGKNSYIYSLPENAYLGKYITEQRKEFFKRRDDVFPRLNEDVELYIEKHGLEPFNKKYQKEINGKKITEMNKIEMLEILSEIL